MADLLFEKFKYDNLDQQKQRKVFDIFKQSYEKATGTSWDERKFRQRAENWLFFGDENGFVTVRPQNAGYYKLTGVAGGIKSILKGLTELQTLNVPVWGMMTPELAHILTSRYGYKKPSKIEAKIIMRSIPPSAFGNVDFKVNKDGSVTFSYKDVGEATKIFVANKLYFSNVRAMLFKMLKDKILSPFKKKVNEGDIDEARAVKYSETGIDTIHRMGDKYGYNNIYISFRDEPYVTQMNVNNSYGTPTGVYCYPLGSIEDSVRNSGSIKDMISSNRPVLSYKYELRYIYLFTLKDKSNVLFTSLDEKDKMDNYVKKIKNIYKNDQRIIELCDQYLSGNYVGEFEGQKAKNPTNNLWLFIYNVVDGSKGKLQDNFTKLCYKIGIQGFVDDTCSKSIHSGEPCQGVFFSLRSIIGEYHFLDADKDRNDVRLHIHNNAYYRDPKTGEEIRYYGKSYEEPKDKGSSNQYKNYLSGILNKSIESIDPKYSSKIKQDKAFWIKTYTGSNNVEFNFIDKDGKSSIKGINPDSDFSGDDERLARAAYYNTALKTKLFYTINKFGKGIDNPDRAFAEMFYDPDSARTYKTIINKRGVEDISGIKDEEFQENPEILAISYNIKLKLPLDKKFIAIYKFGRFVEEPDHAVGKLVSGAFKIINREGKPDLTDVDPTKIKGSSDVLPAYYNQKYNTTDYYNVKYFDDYITPNKDHTVAYFDNGNTYIINVEGKPDIEGLDPADIKDADYLKIYMNQKVGEYKYEQVNLFNGQGIINKNYTLAVLDDNNKTVIINKNGVPDVSALSPSDFIHASYRAIYFNQKIGENKYNYVQDFKDYENNKKLAVAQLHTGEFSLIDLNGNEAYEDIDPSAIKGEYTAQLKARMYNKKLGENKFEEIFDFGMFDNPDRALAKLKNEKFAFINKQGLLDTTEINPTKIPQSYLTQYFNQKAGENKFHKVYEFGYDTGNAHRAIVTLHDGSYIIIDESGEENYKDIDFDEIPDNLRVKIINNELGENKYVSVSSFMYANNNIALAKDNEDNYILINRKGKPDITDVKPTKMEDEKSITAYYNQLWNEDLFSTVYPFFDEPTTVATFKKDGKEIIIKPNGEKATIEEIEHGDVEELLTRETPNYLAAYFNMKLGENKFTSVQPFGKYIESMDFTLANMINNKLRVIDRNGETINGGLDPNKIKNGNHKAIYINQILGEDKYSEVGTFGYFKYAANNIAVAVDKNNLRTFINYEGIPTVEGVAVDEINNKAERAAYYNSLLKNPNSNENFTNIYEFGEHTGNKDHAIARKKDGSFVIINKEGKPDITDVKLDLNYMDYEEQIRAGYFNQMLGKKKFDDVGNFHKIGNTELARTSENDGEYLDLIDKEGKSSTGGLTLKEIEDWDTDYLHVYFNNLLGKKVYRKVHPKYQYMNSEDHYVAEKFETPNVTENIFVIINDKGIPDINGVAYDKLSGSAIRAAYMNQLMNTSKFYIISDFYGEGKDAYAEAKLLDGTKIKINKLGQTIEEPKPEDDVNHDDTEEEGEDDSDQPNESVQSIVEEEAKRAYTQYLKEKLYAMQYQN